MPYVEMTTETRDLTVTVTEPKVEEITKTVMETKLENYETTRMEERVTDVPVTRMESRWHEVPVTHYEQRTESLTRMVSPEVREGGVTRTFTGPEQVVHTGIVHRGAVLENERIVRPGIVADAGVVRADAGVVGARVVADAGLVAARPVPLAASSALGYGGYRSRFASTYAGYAAPGSLYRRY